MTNTVLFDSDVDDSVRREQLYDGQLFVYSPTPSSLALVQLARDLISEAFGGRDPETAQGAMPVEHYAAVLAELKPKFIHHPRSKELIPCILRECGCDLEKTYFDVPRMRTSTSDDYLTTGIAYAFHPHRDTWYSAPPCQMNWWLPIYEIESGNAMAFHPRYWSKPVATVRAATTTPSGTRSIARTASAKHHQGHPAAAARDRGADGARPADPRDCSGRWPPLFSAAQMHSTVPNTRAHAVQRRLPHGPSRRRGHHSTVLRMSIARAPAPRCATTCEVPTSLMSRRISCSSMKRNRNHSEHGTETTCLGRGTGL